MKIKKVMKIGRDATNDLCVQDDLQMSNYHAVIVYENGGYYMRDEKSTNQIWRRLSNEGVQSVPYELDIGDTIKVGSSTFTLEMNE